MNLKLHANPDPGKYNPNFNAKFKYCNFNFRRLPNTIIKKEKLVTLKKLINDDKDKIMTRNKSTNLLENYSTSKLDNTINDNSSTRRKLKNNFSTITQKNHKTLTIDSKNLYKNDMFIRSDNNPDVFSYIEPFNYDSNDKKSIKSLDFKKKMHERSSLINNNIGPAVCTYNPNFNSIYPIKVKSIII